MPTKMPTELPTLTDDNIGRLKSDYDPAPDLDHHIPAAEYNQLRLELVETARLAKTMFMGGTGTLQNAYTNNAGAPTAIQLSEANGKIVVRDTNPATTGILFGVSAQNGSSEWGLWADGLRLHPTSDSAIYGAGGVRAGSGATPAAAAGYLFDTDGTYTLATFPAWEQQSGGARYMAWFPGATPTLGFYNDAAVLLCAWQAGSGSMRLFGSTAQNLLPSATPGSLGTSAEPWSAVHAKYHRAATVTVPFVAALVIDATAGEWQEVTLTGNITSLTLSNFGSTMRLALKFIQDGTGGRTLAGLPATLKLNGGVAFTLSAAANAVSVLWLESDGINFYESGRYLP